MITLQYLLRAENELKIDMGLALLWRKIKD
jgi:hypothetical protein